MIGRILQAYRWDFLKIFSILLIFFCKIHDIFVT